MANQTLSCFGDWATTKFSFDFNETKYPHTTDVM